MSTRYNRIAIGGLLLGLVFVTGVILFLWNIGEGIEPQISYIQASYSFDVNDFRQLMGDADYVFVARVTGVDKTVYKNPTTIETAGGGHKVLETPYTDYCVDVVKNIKGELTLDKEIIVQKAGGISRDGRTIVVFEDDIIPKADGMYIFFAYVQQDGSLLSAGANSTLTVSDQRFSTDGLYKEVTAAFVAQNVTR